jgi:ParB family chromosome partitioning protein
MTTNKKNEPYSSQLRGVDALLETQNTNEAQPPTALTLIETAQLQPSPFQPRHYFDDQQQQQLAESIQQHGILEPLLVRPIANERYEIVAGERRYRAAVEIGLTTVPALIKTLDDKQATQLALIENLQRVNLNPVEETEGILQLLGITLDLETEQVKSLLHRMRDEERQKVPHNVMGKPAAEQIRVVFKAIGTVTWQSFVNNRLPILNLPADILEVLRQGKIEYTKAKEIAKLKDEDVRVELLTEAIAQGLSLSQIKERIKELKPQPDPDPPKVKIRQVSQRLSQQKLWKTDKKKWKKIEGWLDKIEALLAESDNDPSALTDSELNPSEGDPPESDPPTTPD